MKNAPCTVLLQASGGLVTAPRFARNCPQLDLTPPDCKPPPPPLPSWLQSVHSVAVPLSPKDNGFHVVTKLPSVLTGVEYDRFDFRHQFAQHPVCTGAHITVVWDGLAAVLGAKYKYQTRRALVLTLGTAPSAGAFFQHSDGTFEVGAFHNWIWFETIAVDDAAGVVPLCMCCCPPPPRPPSHPATPLGCTRAARCTDPQTGLLLTTQHHSGWGGVDPPPDNNQMECHTGGWTPPFKRSPALSPCTEPRPPPSPEAMGEREHRVGGCT